jgi:short subunit fatty acids transporter
MNIRHIALLLGTASLLASAPSLAATPKAKVEALVTTQLPRNVVPTHYSIY